MAGTPTILLDDPAAPGGIWRFSAPEAVIAARHPSEVGPAFLAMERALGEGRHLAGYFSYELGYVLEPKLLALLWTKRTLPLLWFGVFDTPAPGGEALLGGSGRAYAGPLFLEWDKRAYDRRFAAVRALIGAGDIYQANLSFRGSFRFLGDPLALYRGLREQSAGRYCAFLDDGARQILSLSPELFFETTPAGAITARPMKGTAPRHVDPAADAEARTRLAQSSKDRAENLMIVDLLRNDISRIAETGSVRVEELFSVETYPTLHQLVSTVRGLVRPRLGVESVVRALFPCGSVTGAPKIRAMEVIRSLESSPRGVYCGAIGHFAPDGSSRFNVAIRTLTISGDSGELGIGGGLVQDSTADAEYAECLLKALYFEAARRPVTLIETLRYDTDTGFTRKHLHLDRMERSACAFRIDFDAAGAEKALDAAVSATEGPQRVRLTLDETGHFAATAASLGPTPSHWTYTVSTHRVPSGDALARHKTDWRAHFEREYEAAHAENCDEVLFLNEKGELAEGSRTSIFVERAGKLYTPPLGAGILDGVLRRALIEEGRCVEATLTPSDLETADVVYLGNSLRGLIRGKTTRDKV